MEELVETAMQQGALGLSTSLIYPPGAYARTPELIALARAAARHGGIYASHIRDEANNQMAALEEAITIGREAKIPVEIWHLKVAGRSNWGRMKDVVARIEKARAEGLDVTADMYPYVASGNGLDATVPAVGAGGRSGRDDPALPRSRAARADPRTRSATGTAGSGTAGRAARRRTSSSSPSSTPPCRNGRASGSRRWRRRWASRRRRR